MKKRLVIFLLTALMSITGAMGCGPKETEKADVKTEALVVESTKPKIEKEITNETNNKLTFKLVTKEDKEGVFRNYWQVYEKNKELIFEAEEIQISKYISAKSGLNIRTYPSTAEKNTVYKILPYRYEVISLASSNGWALIELDGNKYFCSEQYLKLERPKAINTNPTLAVNGTYTAEQFRYMGIINWGGWKWTWYSQRVLPGGGLNIPGRHVDQNGYVCDAEGYIVLASGKLSKGTVVNTPFGKAGKVYDSGCAADILDVYTDF